MFAALWHYWACIVLMMVGLYAVISRDNLVKKIMGLTLTQVSVIMFFVAMGKVRGGTAPILVEDGPGAPELVFSNPVPHVLMLTAIVVGVATNALALSIIVRIRESYGTCEEDEIELLDRADAEAEARACEQVEALAEAGGGA